MKPQDLLPLFALALGAALGGVGCAVSETIDFPNSGSQGAAGTAGTRSGAGTPGSAGDGGTTGTAGTGTTGLAGSLGGGGVVGGPGGTTGTAGRGGTTGAGGRGGTTGAGGRGGTTGAGGPGGTTGGAGRGGTTGTAGTTGGTSDGGTATFTQVYASVISANCFGSQCHNPTGGGRPDFGTKAACYNFFKGQGQLYPGMDPQKSYIYSIMHGDPTASPPSPPYMPPDPNPKVSADGLAIVAAWIAGGALNN